MTKTVWIDWGNKVVCQNEDELWADFEESDWGTDFKDWLDNNYTATEIWEAYDGQREVIDKEYEEFRRSEFSQYVEHFFEAYEIRV